LRLPCKELAPSRLHLRDLQIAGFTAGPLQCLILITGDLFGGWPL
jgi:hypothetical protein